MGASLTVYDDERCFTRTLAAVDDEVALAAYTMSADLLLRHTS